MPIGQRHPGVATGPAIGPRLVDPGALPYAPGASAVTGPVGVSLVVIDYRSEVRQATAVAGLITVQLAPASAELLLVIDRLIAQTDSTTPTIARFYSGAPDPDNLIDYTAAGDLAIGDMAAPHIIPGTSNLTCVWSGASAGAIGRLRVQYRVARLVGGS